MIIIGLGMGYATTPTTVLVQSAVGWQMRGAATASNTFTRSIGQTLGIAVFGTIFNNSIMNYGKEAATAIGPSQTALANGIHLVFVMMFFIGIANLIVALLLPSHKKVLEQQNEVR
jgi:MFS family permease